MPSQGARQVEDMGGSREQQQCKADGSEACLPVDGKAVGFASFSTHRTKCWNSIITFLMVQNYVRRLILAFALSDV